MHIILTVNSSWNILNFRRPVVDALLKHGHRVTVLAPIDGAVPALLAKGVRVVPLPMDSKGFNPVRDTAFMRRIHRSFREEDPDVILSYTVKNNIFGALGANRLGIPFIPNVTGLGTAFLSGSFVRTMAKTLYRQAFRDLDTIFFQNDDDLEYFVSHRLATEQQARLLPGSGINLDDFMPMPLPDGPPVFLMIGRMLRDKGVVEFIEAARMVRRRHPGACFRLLGGIGVENRTAIDEATLRAWVAEGTVEYLGTADDVRPAIAAASCVVLPSYREGAPRVLIEAAAMARPVITTDVPGCRFVVDRDISGLMVRVKDSVELAKACEGFIALPQGARVAMGKKGREKMVREFDERFVVEAYLDAIDRATRARRR